MKLLRLIILLGFGIYYLAGTALGAQPTEEAPALEAPAEVEEDERAEDAPEKPEELDEDALFRTRETRDDEQGGSRAGPARARRVDEKPLEEMSHTEARRAGFRFGEQADNESRAAAVFLAATAGMLAHGVGHWYVDEPRTGAALLIGEGVALALVASALLWRWLGEDSAASQVYMGPALYAGVGLFGLTYLLDIIGTAQKGDLGMPQNGRRAQGVSIRADYHYLRLDGYMTDSLQLLSAGSTVDLGWGYLGARTDQDVSLNTALYGATLGARPWRGPEAHDFLFIDADAELLKFDGLGHFRRMGAQARAGISLDLGRLISHLNQVAAGISLGYGHRWYQLPGAKSPDLEQALSIGYIPVETFLHMNLTQELNARVGYEYQQGDLLQSARPGLGLVSLELLYRSSEIIDLLLRAELSGGLGLSGGLRVWVWE